MRSEIAKRILSKNKYKNKLGKIICYLWRHKIVLNDSRYDVCGRCGRHEYYDNDFHRGKPLFKLYFYARFKLLRLKTWYNINFNNQLPF